MTDSMSNSQTYMALIIRVKVFEDRARSYYSQECNDGK